MPSKQKIAEAANAHAKEQLDSDQYKTNKTAVKAISDDFVAGVKWLQAQI